MTQIQAQSGYQTAMRSHMRSAPGQNDTEKQKNMMLRLLATQMANQNPLKPMTTGQVGQQMGTVATLEQQQQTNKLLGALLVSVQSLAQATAKA